MAALALTSLHLLFEIHIHEKLYFDMYIFIAGIFNTWFFLSGIPEDFDEFILQMKNARIDTKAHCLLPREIRQVVALRKVGIQIYKQYSVCEVNH